MQYVLESDSFDSVQELVRYYVGQRKPLSQASGAHIYCLVSRTLPLRYLEATFALSCKQGSAYSPSSQRGAYIKRRSVTMTDGLTTEKMISHRWEEWSFRAGSHKKHRFDLKVHWRCFPCERNSCFIDINLIKGKTDCRFLLLTNSSPLLISCSSFLLVFSNAFCYVHDQWQLRNPQPSWDPSGTTGARARTYAQKQVVFVLQ